MAYVWGDSSPVPKDPSPKSHTNDRSSPSGSVAVAVNVTGLPKTGAAGLHVVCSTLGDRFGLRTRSAATATISRTARTTAAILPHGLRVNSGSMSGRSGATGVSSDFGGPWMASPSLQQRLRTEGARD